jgi:Caspase domain
MRELAVSRFVAVVAAAFILLGQVLAGPAFGASAMPAAGNRLALVIGNGRYENVAELPNPVNDARAVTAALKRIGFSVVEGYDLSFTAMAEKLKTFGRAAEKASVAMVFYAGHGLQMQGTNYFLPVDAKVQRERDLAYDAISLDMILREAEPARDLRIVILDACRDNPFAARIARAGGVTRALQVSEGLAQVGNVGRDTLVAYATAANALADDGSDSHSPYTMALLKHLETPGLEINLLFGRVRDSVFEATAGRQTPFTYGSLGGDPFYLIPPNDVSATRAPVPGNAPEREALFWQALESSTEPADMLLYLKYFPDGPHAGEALRRLQGSGDRGKPEVAALPNAPEIPAAEPAPALPPPAPPRKPAATTTPAPAIVSIESDVPLAKDTILQRQTKLRERVSGAKEPRCATIVERGQLGEGLTDADKSFLRNNC